jgi:peptidoglycan/LPS O-acetylase OafA/YrhL
MLLLVPASLREAAYALGAPKWKVITMVTLRAARAGVITGILLAEKNEPHYYRNFFARRILRIFPLYYAILVLYFVVVPRLPTSLTRNLEAIDFNPLWCFAFLSNWLIALKGRWIQPPLSASWSLAIEEQFYLFWPVVVARLSARALVRVGWAVVVLANVCRIVAHLAGLNAISIYVLPFTRADVLAYGALIAWYRAYEPERLGRWAVAAGRWVIPLTLLGLGISAILGRDSFGMSAVGYSAVALAAAALVLKLAAPSATSALPSTSLRWFEHPALVAIGRRSYGVYLLHVPIVGLLATLGFRPNALAAWPGGPLVAQLALHLLASAVTLALAYVAFHGFERRFLNAKRFFARPESAPINPPAKSRLAG